MCGIAGICDPNCLSLKPAIEKMRDVMAYRGPDGFGEVIFEQDGVALGHRRLSILDLSKLGAQPMTDQSGNLVIVHNGEVYNFIEIRSELESYGYIFRGNTDTEVILAAYNKWGERCLERFNGMFAFAIWNKKRKELFIARDRLGIKPLYYYINDDIFLFASEIKAILTYINKRIETNLDAIDDYMSFGYVPGEKTMFKGIRRLLPGHYILRKSDGRSIRNRKYWDFKFDKSENKGIEHYKGELKRLLNSSIDLRLRSDVPLGIFLSGGLDSSAVVALLAPRVTEKLKTFSVAYDFGPEFNETNYARIVAKKFNTDHHEYIVTPQKFMDFIPGYVWHMDEPVTESAAISLYYISKKARKSVTVILSGEGSDEIFAGYDFYFYNKVIEQYRKLLGEKLALKLGQKLCSVFPDNKFKKYLRMSQLPLELRYKGISTYDEDIKLYLYSKDFNNKIRNMQTSNDFISKIFDNTSASDPLSRMLYFDTKTWLVDDLLIKADRMTMASSLELRVPFLDHRMVEFAASIPSSLKLKKKINKYILKEIMKGILSNEIVNRKKMGFPTPLKLMFQNDLYEYAFETLHSKRFKHRGYFNMDYVERVLDHHKSGIQDNHRLIWQLLVLEEWHRRFIDA